MIDYVTFGAFGRDKHAATLDVSVNVFGVFRTVWNLIVGDKVDFVFG